MTAPQKGKRPPRQVWVLFGADGESYGFAPTKKQATALADDGDYVVGPYVLAERVVQK